MLLTFLLFSYLRNTGTGIGSCFGRVGGVLYPYINYLSKVDTPLAKQLPLLVFGILSIIGGFLALPLPETRQKPLPETIDDVEHYKEFCERMKKKEQERKNLEKQSEMDETNFIVDKNANRDSDHDSVQL